MRAGRGLGTTGGAIAGKRTGGCFSGLGFSARNRACQRRCQAAAATIDVRRRTLPFTPANRRLPRKNAVTGAGGSRPRRRRCQLGSRVRRGGHRGDSHLLPVRVRNDLCLHRARVPRHLRCLPNISSTHFPSAECARAVHSTSRTVRPSPRRERARRSRATCRRAPRAPCATRPRTQRSSRCA